MRSLRILAAPLLLLAASFLLAAAPAPVDDLETTVARMAKIGSCNSPSFSPDGKRLAFVSAISTVEYGDPATEKEMLRALSPLHKLDRVKAPTLVLHGANDTNVPVVEAEQVVDVLKKRGVPVDYVLFPDEGHGFRKAPNRVRASVAIVRWFEEHLAREAAGTKVGMHR